jgi:hypothetical protein
MIKYDPESASKGGSLCKKHDGKIRRSVKIVVEDWYAEQNGCGLWGDYGT